jgi:hypothetical protein
MRIFGSMLLIAALSFGGFWAWKRYAPIQHFIQSQNLFPNERRTLEIRFSAEEIMNTHQKELLRGKGYAFLEPKLLFTPYLLMEVKFAQDGATTREGILLWGLADGEMVLDTSTWEKTHGFEDCLLARANKNEFKILQVLIAEGGFIDRERLYQKFKIDMDVLDEWIEQCRQKKLIVYSGKTLRLHFQDAKLSSYPVTHLDQPLVTQSTTGTSIVPKRYTSSQIQSLAQIAFGQEFAVRKTLEVFLPVYSISVQNPDGSILTTYWNALNGQKLAISFPL